MTCASGASAAIGRSTTIPTGEARAWCCASSRSWRRWRRSRPPGADATRILLDPGGRRSTRRVARDLAERPHLVLVCPRYEGVDERVRAFVDLELSVGDYVVSGGDLPAMLVIDAVLRLLPGAIDPLSTEEESFSDGLLEYPQYTRPPEFRGMRRARRPRLRAPRRGRALAGASRRSSARGGSDRTCWPDARDRTSRASGLMRGS